MNKWLKILSVSIAVLILLVGALLILATVLITPERVKETLLPLAEENLQRKIDLGDIEVSLFSGIEIHGLKLYEENGRDVFVATDLVRLKYQLLPLLAMKVVVDEVRLEKPSIRVVRLKDGTFNFSGLAKRPNSETSRDETPPQGGSASKDSATPINLLVSKLQLQDGQLLFLDHALNNEAPYRYEISGLQVAAKGVSLSGKIPLSMQCQLNGNPLALDGRVNLQPFSVDFDVTMTNQDIVAFSPYFKEALPGKLGGLKLSFDSNLSGTFDALGLKGTVSLAELDLLLDTLPEAPLKNATANVAFDLLFSENLDNLRINGLDLDFNGIKLGAVGKVESLRTAPLVDLQLSVPGLKIREAINAVPKKLVGNVSSLDPAGLLRAEAVLLGTLDDPLALLKSASLDLEEVQATAGGQRPAFSGRLLLSGDHLSSEALHVRLGDNKADIQLQANQLFASPVRLAVDITSKRFLLEPLLQGSAAPVVVAEEVQAAPGGERSKAGEVGPFDIPVHATGTISVKEALWKDLLIRDFVALYELKDNVFNLSRMDGKVAGGSFSNSARVDLGEKGLAYRVRLGLNAVQADPLLTAFVPQAAGGLLGALDLSFDLDGRGTQWQSISRTLTGAGNMLVADGRLASPGLVAGLGSILQVSDLNDIQFDDFVAQFKVNDGKVKLDSKINSKRLKLFPKGSVGLDGSLDLGLDTRLSPELSEKLDRNARVARYLADQDGWTQVPLLLKGNFSSPHFGLDPKGVSDQASKAIGHKLGRQLDKLFKPRESADSSSEQAGESSDSGEDQGRKLLQDSLQKLFGN